MNHAPARVKICGITNLADAEAASALGAWALGMIFFAGSPRRCSVSEAERVGAALRRSVELCGVFVNAPLQDVVAVSENVGLSLLQLHGDEGPSYCAEAARRTGARVIKAVQVSGAGDVRALQRFHVDFHLLDARASQPGARAPGAREPRGGTGEVFDWRLVRARERSPVPLILSGGLNPGNVAAAIELTRPFAVDTASGTESAPGVKDGAKLRSFFAAVHSAAAHEGQQPPPASPAQARRVAQRREVAL